MINPPLKSLQLLRNFQLEAIDGELGFIEEFYFDDHDWTILYLVVQRSPGGLRRDGDMLISPIALGEVDAIEQRLEVLLTKDQIEESPEIDLHKSITRQQEIEYFAHFGWPCFWNGELRASAELVDTPVEVEGAVVGRVSDFLVDESWTIRYLTVDLKETEKTVLISPLWVTAAGKSPQKLDLHVSDELIQSAPALETDAVVERDYEEALFSHYDKPPYWID